MTEPPSEIVEQHDDFLSREPTKVEKLEMRRKSKTPSEWLSLLCKDWAAENPSLLAASDVRFYNYKKYLRGQLSSQLLCRLALQPDEKKPSEGIIDFWKILGIDDEFDKNYINAQVEKFCSLYNIRGTLISDEIDTKTTAITPTENLHAVSTIPTPPPPPIAIQTPITADPSLAVSPQGIHQVTLAPYHLNPLDPNAAAAAAVAAAAVAADANATRVVKKQQAEVTKAHRKAKDAEKALEVERKQSIKREQKRAAEERREQKSRERQAMNVKRAAEKAAREATREERRRKKIEVRFQREKYAQEQKEAALKRAAELVQSNRVPIEITRGAAAATAAAAAAISMTEIVTASPSSTTTPEKKRSSIVVSTASDLQQIVTTAKNLWIKYNAIAKEHNQKVNWITVAKELGIHVKVREKYARMYARAELRGFDFVNCGHYKIKDYPQIFLEPTSAEIVKKGEKNDLQSVIPSAAIPPQEIKVKIDDAENSPDGDNIANSLVIDPPTGGIQQENKVMIDV